MMPRPGDGAKQAAALVALVKERFGLSPGDAVMVSEFSCQTPGCPPVSTHALFWKGDSERYRLRFFKPMKAVTIDDLPPGWLLPGLVDEPGGCC